MWDKVQAATKDYMEHMLDQADSVKEMLEEGDIGGMHPEFQSFLKELQVMCIFPLHGKRWSLSHACMIGEGPSLL